MNDEAAGQDSAADTDFITERLAKHTAIADELVFLHPSPSSLFHHCIFCSFVFTSSHFLSLLTMIGCMATIVNRLQSSARRAALSAHRSLEQLSDAERKELLGDNTPTREYDTFIHLSPLERHCTER
jgi:hypothetical protein